jgi:hypothetical protein
MPCYHVGPHPIRRIESSEGALAYTPFIVPPTLQAALAFGVNLETQQVTRLSRSDDRIGTMDFSVQRIYEKSIPFVFIHRPKLYSTSRAAPVPRLHVVLSIPT